MGRTIRNERGMHAKPEGPKPAKPGPKGGSGKPKPKRS
jgi:hypothetical protein